MAHGLRSGSKYGSYTLEEKSQFSEKMETLIHILSKSKTVEFYKNDNATQQELH